MKSKKIICFLIITLFFVNNSFTQNRKYTKETFQVWGNCGMCKTTIENTVKSLDGVKYAKWNINKGILTVKFQTNMTNLDDIQKLIASTGYDTELYRADDQVYNQLHYCCKYERKKINN